VSSPSLPRQRLTRQRSAIREALQKADGFRSAQQLYDDLRDGQRRVGLTTVYRELQNLATVGQIDALVSPDGETMYRLCGSREHHHHLLCRSCGSSVEVASEEVEAWADRTTTAHGFKDVTHTVELYGVCAACQA